MNPTSPHLKALDEIEKTGVPGLLEVFRKGASTLSGTPSGADRLARG